MSAIWGLFPADGILRKAEVNSDGTFGGWLSDAISGVPVPDESHLPRITAFMGHPTLDGYLWWGDTDDAGHVRLWRSDGLAITNVWSETVGATLAITAIYVEAVSEPLAVWFTVGQQAVISAVDDATNMGIYRNTDSGATLFDFISIGQESPDGSYDDDFPGIQDVKVDESNGNVWTASGRQAHDRIINKSTDGGTTWLALGPGPDDFGQCQNQLLWMFPWRGPMSEIRYQSSELGAIWLIFNLSGSISGASGRIGNGGFFMSDPSIGIWASYPRVGASGNLRRTTNGGATIGDGPEWAGEGANVNYGEGAYALHRTAIAAMFVDNSAIHSWVTVDGGATWAIYDFTDYSHTRDIRWWWLEEDMPPPPPAPEIGDELYLIWKDLGLGERLTVIHGTTGLGVLPFQLEPYSNADWREYVIGAINLDNDSPVDAVYNSVGDVLLLQCATDDVEDRPIIVIPAPKGSIFEADGTTMNLANLDVVEASLHIVGNVRSPLGNLVTQVSAGRLVRRASGVQ